MHMHMFLVAPRNNSISPARVKFCTGGSYSLEWIVKSSKTQPQGVEFCFVFLNKILSLQYVPIHIRYTDAYGNNSCQEKEKHHCGCNDAFQNIIADFL